MEHLRDASSVPVAEQLVELLGYQKTVDQCKYRNDSTHVFLLQRIGALYRSQNDFVNAIKYTNDAISMIDRQKNSPRITPSFAIKCFWNLSTFYDGLKLFAKKEAAMDSCISRVFNLHSGYAFGLPALEWKILHLFETGDYYRCLDLIKLGELMVRESGMMPAELEKYDIAYFIWKINALNFLNQSSSAEKLVANKIREHEKSNKASVFGPLNSLYAEVLINNNHPLEGINRYKKSFEYNLKIGHTVGCSEALNNIGYTYSTVLHQNKTALVYYLKALTFASANESLNIYDNIANAYVQAGNYDSAFIYYQKAFDQVEPGFNETGLLKMEKAESDVSVMEYVTGLVLDKADAYLSNYKSSGQKQSLQKAIRIYQVTDRYFDKLKASQTEIQSKLFWKTNNRRLYEHAIEACYVNQNTPMAFYFFEKSRSILLNDQIMQQRRMDDASIAKQAQLKRNVLELERALEQAGGTSKEHSTIQKQLYNTRLELEILNKKVNGVKYSYTKDNADTATLTIQQVRINILKGRKSLLEIFTGDSSVYILCVTPQHEFFTGVDKKLYDSLTTSYISFIASRALLNKNFPGFVTTANQLYKLIFKNIELPPTGSLIVSPDGKSFPFECLASDLNLQTPHYLLKDYAISYTYSAKYLANQIEAGSTTAKSILGMAPVNYHYNLNLSGLPGSDVSLENIKRQFNSADNYILKNATRHNFLQNFSDYRIIQLYTHAADNIANNDPVIYFADSILSLSDLIPDRKPLTQLVVLSACETANGKLYEGEGIFSFNRGFAALGIPAAVSNLWSVDNISTYRITELFYKYLAQGVETDVALQKAKLEFIASGNSRDQQLPYYWAGTILVGKADTIRSGHQFPLQAEILLGGILLLAGIGIRQILLMRNRRKRAIIFDAKES